MLESLRLEYPKKVPLPPQPASVKGSPGGKKKGEWGGKGTWSKGGDFVSKSQQWLDSPPPRVDNWRRDRSRSNRRQQGQGKDKGKGKDKSGGTTRFDPKVMRAFQLAKEGGKLCPFYQSGSCLYPDTCNFKHYCFICGSSSHGAHKCTDLNSNRGKEKLRM